MVIIIVILAIIPLFVSGCVSPSDVMDNLYTKNVYPDVIGGPFTIGDVGNPFGAGYFDNLYINGSVINSSGMIGPQGPQGLPGINGTNGINGSNGIDGTNGTNGTNGIDGAPGINGSNGTNGTNGTNGATGAAGAAGPNIINNSTQTTFTGFLTGNGSYVNAQSLNISIDANGNVIVYGTLTLSDTVWEDIRIVPGSFDRPGNADPVYVAYIPGGSGITTYLTEWQKADFASCTVQMPHSYKVGTDIYVHIHWTPGTRGNEEIGNAVGWKITYTWADIDGTFGSMATLNLSDTCDGTDHKHQMMPDIVISGSGKGISSMLICNIERTDTGADDTWVGTVAGSLPMMLEMDFHYEIDTMGSRIINAK